MNILNFTIRIDECMLEKIRIISKYEMHSVNSQIKIIILQAIKKFEEEHGEIKGENNC